MNVIFSSNKIINNSSKKNIYPYIFRNHGKEKILLWVDGGKDKDYFLMTCDGRLVLMNSLEHFHESYSNVNNLILHYEEAAETDMDQFWKTVRGIRKDKSSSTKTCSILLNGWNFIEDLAYTLGVSKNLQIYNDTVISYLYQKLFSGNNLTPVTPEGCEYSPIWTKEEVKNFRFSIRQLWLHVIHRAPEIGY